MFLGETLSPFFKRRQKCTTGAWNDNLQEFPHQKSQRAIRVSCSVWKSLSQQRCPSLCSWLNGICTEVTYHTKETKQNKNVLRVLFFNHLCKGGSWLLSLSVKSSSLEGDIPLTLLLVHGEFTMETTSGAIRHGCKWQSPTLGMLGIALAQQPGMRNGV